VAEEREGVCGEVGSGVGVAGQFDDGQALVAGGREGRQDLWEVDLSVPEGEVLVDTAPHVLDLDVPQPWGGVADAVGGREAFEALAVADVEGESERFGVAEDAAKAVEVGQGGEEVTWFGFDGERDAGGGGGVQDGGEGLGEALPGGVRVGAVGDDAAEAVDGVGAEVGRDADGPGQQVDPAGPVVGVGVEQGRAVLAARVEHIAGARLHRDAQTERVQPVRDPAGAGGQVGGERVEVHVVEGQSDTVVAEVGEEGERVVEPEVGETVGAVAEAEGREGGGPGV
jgi:hypothetical protein